jgi:putative ABC transport system substrate-binding protein
VFVDQLRQFGWVDGQNLSIEWRLPEGHDELLPDLASDLVRLPVEIIATFTSDATLAAIEQTTTIPIVFIGVPDPLGFGVVQAHNGGNVTGASFGGDTMSIKSVELLKTVVPYLSRLVILGDHANIDETGLLGSARGAAETIAIQVQHIDVRSLEDVDRALQMTTMWRAEGLVVLESPTFTAGMNACVTDFAARERVPTMYMVAPTAVTDFGGLIAFSADPSEMNRQGAEQVDKILRGAKPADLPVQAPRQFEFMVNVKAAQDLGITFPPDVADQVTQWVQ